MRPPRFKCVGFLSALLSVVVVAAPLGLLGYQGASAFLRYTDGLLKQAAPLAASEASVYLKRNVTLGGLTPGLSVRSVYEAIRNPGSLMVEATDIALYNRPGEERLAGTPLLARADRVTLAVSLPAVLSGDFTRALPRVTLDGVTLNLVRYKNGRLNVLDIVPPQPKPAKAQPPFLTYIDLNGGRLRFRDYAAKRPAPELPAENDLVIPSGYVDLSGPRVVTYAASGRAAPGSVTVARVGAALAVSGYAPRGKAEDARPDAPARGAPFYAVRIRAGDADLPYWGPYLAPLPQGFRLGSGRGDFDVALAAPQPAPGAKPLAPNQLPPGFNLSVSGAVRNVALSAPGLPVPVTGAAGTFTYGDGAVTFDAGARLIGQAVSARGAVWGLPAPGGKPGAPLSPSLSVAFDAPRVPVTEALRAFVPAAERRKLPPGLSLGGVVAVRGTVGGTLRLPGDGAARTARPADPAALLGGLVATGTVSGVNASYPGYPAVRGAQADLTLAGGVLRVANASASVGRGGSVRGQGTLRLTGGPTERGNAVFKARAAGIDLSALRPVQEANRGLDPRLRLAGVGTVEAAGRLAGGKLTAAANVAADGLRVGALSFPVVRARVLVDDNRIAVPAARVLSPAGAVTVKGNVAPGGGLNLSWTAAGLDLLALGQAFGVDGLSGYVTANGTAGGTVKEPRLTVADLYGLNLRFRASTGDGTGQSRRIALDTLDARGIVVTRQAVRLTEPLTLRRFPATVSVQPAADPQTGNPLPVVAGFLPARPGLKADPALNFRVTVTDLDTDEVQQQLGASEPFSARRSTLADARFNTPLLEGLEDLPWNRGAAVFKRGTPPVLPLNPDAPPFGGVIRRATVAVSGTLSNPRARGEAVVSSAVVGPYPLGDNESATGGDALTLAFAYENKTVLLSSVTVNASAGTITGSARVAPDGTITGSFSAPRVDVQQLAFLTKGAVALDGFVQLSGAFSGTLTRPVVTADLTSQELFVAGTRLTDVAVSGVRYAGDLRPQATGGRAAPKAAGQVEVGEISLKQGASSLRVARARYDLASGAVSAAADVNFADVGAFVDALRSSGLANTDAGARILRGLSRVPEPVGGSLALSNVTFTGRVADGKLEDPHVNGSLRGRGIRVGPYTTDTLEADASFRDGIINLSRFVAARPDATIRANGTYNPDGDIDFTLDANQASLDVVRTFPGLEGFPVRGKLDISVTARGPSDRPEIRGSVYGQNLLVLTGAAAATPTAPAAVAAVPAGTPAAAAAPQAEKGILISSVNLIAYLERGENGRTRLVTEARVSKQDAAVELTGSLPFSFDPDDATLADQPLDLRLQVPRFDLARLADVFRVTAAPATEDAASPTVPTAPGTGLTPVTAANSPVGGAASTGFAGQRRGGAAPRDADAERGKLGGAFAANVRIGGTLRQPALSGSVDIENAQFTPPRAPGGDRDLISPVRDLDATLLFDGTNVYFKDTVLTLGGLNGERGEFGTMALTGGIKVNNLENLQEFLKGGRRAPAATAGASRLDVNAVWDVEAEFKGFRPAEDNLAGLGEAGKSRIDGRLAVTGRLLAPQISTPANQPLRLSGTDVRVPSVSQKEALPGGGGEFNPSFDIRLAIADRAAVTNPALFRFEVQGGAEITGRLFRRVPLEQADLTPEQLRLLREQGYGRDYVAQPAFQVRSTLRTVGGYLQLPTARFNVKKDGVVSLRYGTPEPGVYVSDVTATTRIYTQRGAQFGAGQSTGALAVTTQRPVSTPAVGYDVTVTLNGRLDLLNEGADLRNQPGSGRLFSFRSDPPLAESEIVALLIPQQQFEQASQGRVEAAVRSFAAQALTSGYLPRLLSPITQGVASTFGLEDLTVNYNPDAPLQVRALKRLPDPFQRFLVDFSRTFGRRNQPSQLQPYTFGLSYEVYQFGGAGLSYQPRVQVGFQTDEQRTVTYFLRGSVIY